MNPTPGHILQGGPFPLGVVKIFCDAVATPPHVRATWNERTRESAREREAGDQMPARASSTTVNQKGEQRAKTERAGTAAKALVIGKSGPVRVRCA